MIFGMVILCSALSFFFFCLFVWLVFNKLALFVRGREEVKGKCVVQYLHVFEQL